jgi:hypothetical protein
MEQFTTYSKFLDLRQQLTDYALSNAIFSEKRETECVRPIVKIRTTQDLTAINKLIATWQVLVDQLCTESPERFNRASSTFSPEPRVLYDVCQASITINEATSTRKIAREDILRRLRKARTSERHSGSPSAKTNVAKFDREISFFNAETEESYRLRSDGYTEVIMLIRSNKKDDFEKVRVSYAGVFIFDPKNECEFSLPNDENLGNRGDKIENMKIKPVKYSLARRGQLFRTTDLQEAKRSAAEERNSMRAITTKKASKELVPSTAKK